MNEVAVQPGVRRDQGIAMLELAFLLPLMIVILVGFVEIGRALYQENVLTKAVITGVRFLARAPGAVTDACTPGDAWLAATTQAAALVAYLASDGTEPRLQGLDEAGAVEFTVRPESTGNGVVCVIRGEGEAGFVAMFGMVLVPFITISPLTLRASVEESYIGE